jgi:penicillin-binding protein 2
MVEHFSYAKHVDFGGRARRVSLVMIVFLAIVVVRLVQLQIILGDPYRRLSDNNRFRPQRLDAPRGLILDRNGEVLVDNRRAFALSAVPTEVEDPEGTVKRLDELVIIDSDETVRRIDELKRSSVNAAMHVSIKEDIPFREVALVEEAMTDLPGIIIVSKFVRRYVFGDLAATVLGYVGKIDKRQLEIRKDSGYTQESLIGKTGIERACEESLRGVDGGLLVEVHSVGKPQLETYFREGRREQSWVDSVGRKLRSEKRRDPVPGDSVYLTIDRRVQQLCEEKLADVTGAIVVMDVDTGELLALASKPSYDPNIFVGTGNASRVREVLDDPTHPLFSRGVQATYAPGSTVKPIIAIAALEEGIITPEREFACYGSYYMGRRFRCWNRNGHGSVSVVDALAYSCDVFFYQVGELLGPEKIAEYSHMFGLGRSTGFVLAGEKSGFVPTVAWKRRRFGESWYRGDTANISIGQGAMLATPLQMARVYAALVNGGRLLEPRLIEMVSEDGEIVSRPQTRVQPVLDVRRETFNIITAGLRKAVEKDTFPTGTGHLAKVEGVDVIGKTGTAQVVAKKRGDEEEDPESTSYKFRDHAWFTAVVTDKKPRVVVCVLVEHGGHGGDVSAPIAAEVIRSVYAGEDVVQPRVVASSSGGRPHDGDIEARSQMTDALAWLKEDKTDR